MSQADSNDEQNWKSKISLDRPFKLPFGDEADLKRLCKAWNSKGMNDSVKQSLYWEESNLDGEDHWAHIYHAVVAAGTRWALSVNLEPACDGAAAGVALAVGLGPAVTVLPVIHHTVPAQAVLTKLTAEDRNMSSILFLSTVATLYFKKSNGQFGLLIFKIWSSGFL